jgi:YD repeat-containing protein
MKFHLVSFIFAVSLFGCKQQPPSEEQVNILAKAIATNTKEGDVVPSADSRSKSGSMVPDVRSFIKETGMDLEAGQNMNDESGRLVKTVFPDQSVIRYQNGYPIEFLRPSGESTQFQFDENGKHLRTIHADGRIEIFIYDAQGNKVKK